MWLTSRESGERVVRCRGEEPEENVIPKDKGGKDFRKPGLRGCSHVEQDEDCEEKFLNWATVWVWVSLARAVSEE